MSGVSFSFQGWVSLANIESVTVTETGEELDVRTFEPPTIVEKLNSGEWGISLADYLYENHRSSEIEIFDFEGVE